MAVLTSAPSSSGDNLVTSHLVIAALQGDGPLPVAALPATVAVLAEPRSSDNDNDDNDDNE